MSDQAAGQQTPVAGAEAGAQQPIFQIEKLYVKDLSLEVPNAPQVFMQAESPQLEIQLRNEATQVMDGLYDIAVTVTVTATSGEKNIFLAEVVQCGIFQIRGFVPEEFERVLEDMRGKRWTGARVRQHTEAMLPGSPYAGSVWRQAEGAALWDLGPHALSVLTAILGPVEKISADTDRDFIMSAIEAKEYGIIDEILSNRDLASVGVPAGVS